MVEVTELTRCRSYFLPDPTALETPLLPTSVIIALDEEGRACLLRLEGMGGLKEKGVNGEEMLGKAWMAAEGRCRELRRVLDDSGR